MKDEDLQLVRFLGTVPETDEAVTDLRLEM